MAIDKQDAIQHLDSVLEDYATNRRDGYIAQPSLVRTRLVHAIERLAPPGSEHAKAVRTDLIHDQEIEHLAGIAKALRMDYLGGYLNTYRELFNAELFSDFLKMAEYLLESKNLKDPAAVLAGSVLEEHIRKLCEKHGVDTEPTDANGKVKPKKFETMNTDLRKDGAYGKNDQMQATAWYAIRNDAAHGNYGGFDDQQVAQMIQGIRTFILRYPA